LTQHTIELMPEVTTNPLASTVTNNLKEYFDKFCLPSNLRECVDQYRVDRFDAAMRKHGLVTEDLWLTVSRGEIPFPSFSDVFDPFTYYDDSGPVSIAPGTFVVMPPVPAKVFDGLAIDSDPLVQMDIDCLAEHLTEVPTKKVLGLAWAVAAYYLDDEPGFGRNREAAIAYIALNDVQNSFHEHAVKREVWSSRTRGVTLPNMLATRKDQFREVFARAGQPINEVEFECMPLGDIIEYATDQRAVMLGHNRHMVFCFKCSRRQLEMMNTMHYHASDLVM
jgi:hypothetical protein